MAEQVRGVLREVVAVAEGRPRPETSGQFTRERRVFGSGEDGRIDGGTVSAALPLPLPDPADPGIGFLATLATTDPEELIAVLAKPPVQSMEVGLRLVGARIEAGDTDGAIADIEHARGWNDWRLDWYRGLAMLRANRPAEARAAFDAVYSELPGEPAAKLALAAACELADVASLGDRPTAADPRGAELRYERVWLTDHDFVSAAFGLARMRLARGERLGCVAVLDDVPDSSSQYFTAQVAAVRAKLRAELAHILETDLLDASTRVVRLQLEGERNARLRVELLERSLAWIGGGSPSAGSRVLGHELHERALRLGLENAYRELAKMAPDPEARVSWVDRANRVRPRTWV
jgi:serine/threonine-protein kinase PknG